VRPPPPAAKIKNNQVEIIKAFCEKNFPDPDSEEEERAQFEESNARREDMGQSS
jgi:hypothetical protein